MCEEKNCLAIDVQIKGVRSKENTLSSGPQKEHPTCKFIVAAIQSDFCLATVAIEAVSEAGIPIITEFSTCVRNFYLGLFGWHAYTEHASIYCTVRYSSV